MRNYSDPTARQAVGTITKEWNKLSRIAKKIRENPDSEWARSEIRRFTGIYQRLLTEVEDEGRDAS